MNDPFKPATPIAKKLKLLFYGPSGSGKTWAALTFPRVALIDAENGSDLYAGRPGIPKFSVLHAKRLSEVEQAVRFIQADGGKSYDTLVLDPVTVAYEVEKTAESSNNTKDLGFREWARINNRMAALYTSLTNLPAHVILIARETPEYATRGSGLERVGVKPDADKKLVYMMDFVVRFQNDHSAVVEKSRGVVLGKAGVLPKVSWADFETIAAGFADGKKIEAEDENSAAEEEAIDLRNLDNAKAFVAHWRAQGLSDGDMLAALNVTRFSEWTQGRVRADEAINVYISARTAMPATPMGSSNGGGR
jgi:hypothetical protein